MVLGWTSALRFRSRQERVDSLPLFIGEVASVSHGTQFIRFLTICMLTLGIANVMTAAASSDWIESFRVGSAGKLRG